MKIDKRIFNLMVSGSRAQRVKICEQEPMYFALYYFSQYFVYTIPPFHYDFYQDCKDLTNGTLEEAAWIAYRESAKTSLAKVALLVWCIVYRKKNYINVDSYDKGNAESFLFDATVALQTNKKIIADFGQLYHKKQSHDTLSEAKMKRINNFITENDVKVEAFSTQESTRGRVYKERRPDLFILDDVENDKTKDSYPITHKIKMHIEELKAGLSVDASVLYLGNYIAEDGVISFVMERVKANPRGRLREVPVVSKDGVISWPDKYVFTNHQAAVANLSITDRRQHKISLEARRASLGAERYASDMMNDPAKAGGKVFDRETIETLLKQARKPVRTVADFKLWFEYNPAHRYAVGADTAKGVGVDSSASCLIDFSTIPNRLVGTYKNNTIPPDIFAHELRRQGEMFGECLVAPEVNSQGYATVAQLKKIYPLSKIYLPLREEKVSEKLADEYGWDTNSATKPEMIYQLKQAVEDGKLAIFDEDVLNELKYYGQKDLTTMKLVEGMTRHFDLVMALAIAWAMRNHAKLPIKIKKIQQKPYQPVAGEYGG